MSKEYDDEHLVKSYQTGDEEAANTLCQNYWVPLHWFFNKRIRNSEEAKDLVQETFLEALKTLENGQTPRKFRPWIYKIAARVLGKWRAEQQKPGRPIVLDAPIEDESGQISFGEPLLAPQTTQPEHQTLDNELGAIRSRFEGSLNPRELSVFRLRHHTDMTFEQIGEFLDIDPGTAKVQYHRTRVAFKTYLQKYYPDIYDWLNEE